MKTILVAIAFVVAVGCSSVPPLQVEMVKAELVKIDTIFRQEYEKKQLTWRDLNNNIEYVSFVSMHETYPLGTTIFVMRTR